MKFFSKALQHSLLSPAFMAAFAVYGAYAATITVDARTDKVGGGGGCTMNPDAQFDGGLLAMLAAAMGGLMLRSRRSATRE